MWFLFFTGKEFLGNLIKVEFAEKRVPKGGFRGGGGRGTVSLVNDYNGMSYLLIYEVIRLFCLVYASCTKNLSILNLFCLQNVLFQQLLSFCKQPVTLIFKMKFTFVAEDNNFIHDFKVRVASHATRVKGLKVYFCTSLVSGQARWQTCCSMVSDLNDRKLIS